GGETYYDFLDPVKDVVADNGIDSFGGYFGKYYTFPYTNGRAAMAMFEWYAVSGDRQAFDLGSKLTAFLRAFAPIWDNPDPARFPDDGPGQFAGHIHSYLPAAHAFTEEASARLKADPHDPIAANDIARADAMYGFVKRRTQGDVLGNFGEMDGPDDMIRLGIALSQLGRGPYWEEVERWTRNILADRQIDAETARRYIGNPATGDYATDHVGDKVTGMWFSDATHSLAVPHKAWMYDIDDATNPMHAAWEVWAHTVTLKGNEARVNFALNRAGKYLDVKSDLPYRGRIEIVLKRDLGPVAALAVRVPGWAERGRVSVAARERGRERSLQPGRDWSWSEDGYVRLAAVRPAGSVILRFPIVVRQLPFRDIRSPDQWWYEGDYGSPRQNAAETVEAFVGTFRGDTLVDASPRPKAGIPRFQRQSLAALPPHDVAPPSVRVRRFVAVSAPP
ncbi:MAG TPA: hypothetical protein VE993_06420, partial [Stellaceae bacterium]|nr:hypothetical protein [Stellaceae bacterium]